MATQLLSLGQLLTRVLVRRVQQVAEEHQLLLGKARNQLREILLTVTVKQQHRLTL